MLALADGIDCLVQIRMDDRFQRLKMRINSGPLSRLCAFGNGPTLNAIMTNESQPVKRSQNWASVAGWLVTTCISPQEWHSRRLRHISVSSIVIASG